MESQPPLVFLPGWGFDASLLTLAPHWPSLKLTADVSDPAAAVERLVAQLDAAGIEQADLCGWSLGARVALDFRAACPHRVRQILLVSVRPTFPPEAIAAERVALERDPPACLAGFYRRAFIGQKEDGARFAAQLSAAHLAELTSERITGLLAGLDYLAARSVTAMELAASAARLYHGGRDLIAPVVELQSCLAGLSAAEAARITLHVEPGVGHVPVVTPAFAHWLANATR